MQNYYDSVFMVTQTLTHFHGIILEENFEMFLFYSLC